MLYYTGVWLCAAGVEVGSCSTTSLKWSRSQRSEPGTHVTFIHGCRGFIKIGERGIMLIYNKSMASLEFNVT